jgi:hypothetical protein
MDQNNQLKLAIPKEYQSKSTGERQPYYDPKINSFRALTLNTGMMVALRKFQQVGYDIPSTAGLFNQEFAALNRTIEVSSPHFIFLQDVVTNSLDTRLLIDYLNRTGYNVTTTQYGIVPKNHRNVIESEVIQLGSLVAYPDCYALDKRNEVVQPYDYFRFEIDSGNPYFLSFGSSHFLPLINRFKSSDTTTQIVLSPHYFSPFNSAIETKIDHLLYLGNMSESLKALKTKKSKNYIPFLAGVDTNAVSPIDRTNEVGLLSQGAAVFIPIFNALLSNNLNIQLPLTNAQILDSLQNQAKSSHTGLKYVLPDQRTYVGGDGFKDRILCLLYSLTLDGFILDSQLSQRVTKPPTVLPIKGFDHAAVMIEINSM